MHALVAHNYERKYMYYESTHSIMIIIMMIFDIANNYYGYFLNAWHQIISDTITFVVVGFHTLAYLFTWLMWYMADNPDAQDRLRAEILSVVGEAEYGEKLREYTEKNNT